MNDNNDKDTEIATIDATPTGIMSAVDVSDYSQFLYNANFSGKQHTDFTAEGIKTLCLQFGISTSEVDIEFLNEEKTEALFKCTATNRQGDTASATIHQSQNEFGKVNRHWIEKGVRRARRNAQRELLPVQLLKTTLQKAIARGEAEKSEIQKAQQQCTEAYKVYKGKGGTLSKAQCLEHAEDEFSIAYAEWDSELWQMFCDALKSDNFHDTINNGGA